YQAANWQRVGETQGRTRQDRYHALQVPINEIYAYPLQKHFRKVLVNEPAGRNPETVQRATAGDSGVRAEPGSRVGGSTTSQRATGRSAEAVGTRTAREVPTGGSADGSASPAGRGQSLYRGTETAAVWFQRRTLVCRTRSA